MGKAELPLTDQHFRCIGKVAAYFTLLEEMLSYVIWSFIGSEQPLGQIITAGLSFKQKISLLSSLYLYRMNRDKEPAELKKLLSRATQSEDKRNTILHSVWGGYGRRPGKRLDTVARIKPTTKRAQRYKSQDMTAQDLNEIADFIAEVEYDVDKFFFAYKTAVRAVLRTLLAKESEIIRMYFGIGFDRMSLEEIAQEVKLSKQTIRVKLARALRKCRHPSRSRTLREFLDTIPVTGERTGEQLFIEEVFGTTSAEMRNKHARKAVRRKGEETKGTPMVWLGRTGC